MSFRTLVSRELAEMLAVLAHRDRLRIVEELAAHELDVGTLAQRLGLSQPGTSHHLRQLRAQRLVVERREGRHVHYRLRDPRLAAWLVDGLELLESQAETSRVLRSSLRRARAAWSQPD